MQASFVSGAVEMYNVSVFSMSGCTVKVSLMTAQISWKEQSEALRAALG